MNIIHNADLSEILWYKIGGKAKFLLEISSIEDLEEAFLFLKQKDLIAQRKFFIIGYGSNLIFARGYYDGAVLRFVKNTQKKAVFVEKVNPSLVTAFAGESLDRLITYSFSQNLIGLEWAGGLPGTVGAAVRGNVGAFGGEIKDSLQHAEIAKFEEHGMSFLELSAEQMNFSYRESIVKEHRNLVVVSATFHLQKGNEEEVAAAQQVYEKNIQHRKDRHPLEYPNCGSVFKNIKDKKQIEKVLEVYPDLAEDIEKKWYGKVAVATLIERLGLKGFRVGNAQVSEKHALFIVNLGGASADDVISIINTIQQKFQETFGFQLETEVEIIR